MGCEKVNDPVFSDQAKSDQLNHIESPILYMTTQKQIPWSLFPGKRGLDCSLSDRLIVIARHLEWGWPFLPEQKCVALLWNGCK